MPQPSSSPLNAKGKRPSLLGRALVATLTPLVVFGVVVTLAVGTLVGSILSETIGASARAELEAQTDRLQRFLEERRAYLEILARSPEVRSGDLDRIRERLAFEERALADTFEGLYYDELDGTVHPTRGATFSVADRPYFAQVLRGELVIGELVVSRATNRRIALVIVPIRGPAGELRAALAGTALIEDTLASIARTSIGLGSVSGIVSDEGDLLAGHPFAASLVATASDWKTRSGGFEPREIELAGTSWSTWVTTVAGSGWRYVIAWPEDALYAPVQTLRLIVMGLVALAVVVALGGAIALRRGLARPAADIAAALGAYATNTRARAPVTGPAELAELAQTFNQMADRIQQETEARQKLEAGLAQTQRLESIGRLAGGIAHDFNNLLTVITTLIDLVKTRVTDEEVRADLGAMEEASRQAAALTSQLLAFARRGHRQTEVIVVDDSLVAITKVLRRLLPESIQLEVACQAPGARVEIDPTELMQVVVNLCVNGRDAMPRGGTLRVATHLEDRDIVLSVTDRGAGIPPEIIDHIFEPFYTTKSSGRGTGLGLATCFGIVSRANGTISVTSSPERGTTFTVRLPTTEREASPGRPEPSVARSERRRILLVEDDALVRETLRLLLERAGHGVTACDGAATARDQLAKSTFDLLLTDVRMPGESGTSLASWALETSPTIEVLLMSGFVGNEDLTTLATHPRAGFIAKPFETAELLARIQSQSGA